MTNTKITIRDRFNSIIEVLSADATANADLIEFCQAEIAKLDKKAEKAKAASAAKKSEVDALRETVQQVLADWPTDDYVTIDEIVAAINDPEVTRQKVANRLGKLREDGLVESEDKKAPTEGNKSRTVKAYRLI